MDVPEPPFGGRLVGDFGIITYPYGNQASKMMLLTHSVLYNANEVLSVWTAHKYYIKGLLLGKRVGLLSEAVARVEGMPFTVSMKETNTAVDVVRGQGFQNWRALEVQSQQYRAAARATRRPGSLRHEVPQAQGHGAAEEDKRDGATDTWNLGVQCLSQQLLTSSRSK